MELEFEPKSKLNTEGINVLKTVNDKPTTNEIKKKIDRIEFCPLSLKSFKLIISIFLVLGMNFKESGIKKYEGRINNQWILMEYDHKRKLLKYDFNKIVKKGENQFTLEVTDMLNNIKKYLHSIDVNCIYLLFK